MAAGWRPDGHASSGAAAAWPSRRRGSAAARPAPQLIDGTRRSDRSAADTQHPRQLLAPRAHRKPPRIANRTEAVAAQVHVSCYADHRTAADRRQGEHWIGVRNSTDWSSKARSGRPAPPPRRGRLPRRGTRERERNTIVRTSKSVTAEASDPSSGSAPGGRARPSPPTAPLRWPACGRVPGGRSCAVGAYLAAGSGLLVGS